MDTNPQVYISPNYTPPEPSPFLMFKNLPKKTIIKLSILLLLVILIPAGFWVYKNQILPRLHHSPQTYSVRNFSATAPNQITQADSITGTGTPGGKAILTLAPNGTTASVPVNSAGTWTYQIPQTVSSGNYNLAVIPENTSGQVGTIANYPLNVQGSNNVTTANNSEPGGATQIPIQTNPNTPANPTNPTTNTGHVFSCPVPEGKISCGSYGPPTTFGGFTSQGCSATSGINAGTGIGGHCSPQYIADQGICNPVKNAAGDLIRTAKSIDITDQGSGIAKNAGDPVYLPTIDGHVVTWQYIGWFDAGTGYARVYHSVDAPDGQVWTLQYLHVYQNITTPNEDINVNDTKQSWHIAGNLVSQAFVHLHMTVGLNVGDRTISESGSTADPWVHSPNWVFADRDIGMCTGAEYANLPNLTAQVDQPTEDNNQGWVFSAHFIDPLTPNAEPVLNSSELLTVSKASDNTVVAAKPLDNVGLIVPGQSKDDTLTTGALDPGSTYNVRACADYTNQSPESNESDNCVTKTITTPGNPSVPITSPNPNISTTPTPTVYYSNGGPIQGPFPDLTVQNTGSPRDFVITATPGDPKQITTGKSLSFAATIVNALHTGCIASNISGNSFTTSFAVFKGTFPKDAIPTGRALFTGFASTQPPACNGQNGGEVIPVSEGSQWTVSQPGAYSVRVCADSNHNLVSEPNILNNCTNFPLIVTSPVTGNQIPPPVNSGGVPGGFPVSVDVSCDGTTPKVSLNLRPSSGDAVYIVRTLSPYSFIQNPDGYHDSIWVDHNYAYANIPPTDNAASGIIKNDPADFSGFDGAAPDLVSGTSYQYIMSAGNPAGSFDGTSHVLVTPACTTPVQVTCSAAYPKPGPLGTPADTVIWTANATAGNGTYDYSWSGDPASHYYSGLDGKTAQVDYAIPGTYQATVTVKSGGTTATANCQVNTATNSASHTPAASPTPNPTSPANPQPVNFKLGVKFFSPGTSVSGQTGWNSANDVASLAYIQRSWNDLHNPDISTDVNDSKNAGLDTYIAFDPLCNSRNKVASSDGTDHCSDSTPVTFQNQYSNPDNNSFINTMVDIARTYHPKYLLIGLEVNTYKNANQTDYNYFAHTLYPKAYDAIKAVSSNTQVAVSFTANSDLRQELADFNNKVDVLAVSLYPEFSYGSDINNIPTNLLSSIIDSSGSNLPLFISETGWISTSWQSFPASPDAQSAYINRLRQMVDQAKNNGKSIAAINYVSLADVNCNQQQISSEFGWYCYLGLMSPNGSPKPAFQEMRSWKNNAPSTISPTSTTHQKQLISITVNGQQIYPQNPNGIDLNLNSSSAYLMEITYLDSQGHQQTATRSLVFQRPAVSPTTSPTDTGWTFCSNEFENCSIPGNATVRFGANGQFITKVFAQGTYVCGNGTFGSDPAPTILKRCEYQLGGNIVPTNAPIIEEAAPTPTPSRNHPNCRSISCPAPTDGCTYQNQITSTCDANVTLTCGNLVCTGSAPSANTPTPTLTTPTTHQKQLLRITVNDQEIYPNNSSGLDLDLNANTSYLMTITYLDQNGQQQTISRSLIFQRPYSPPTSTPEPSPVIINPAPSIITDIAAENLSLSPQSPTVGQPVSFEADTANLGTVALNPTTTALGVIRSSNPSNICDTTVSFTTFISTIPATNQLNPGSSQHFSYPNSWTPTEAGNYCFAVIADFYNQVNDNNPANNRTGIPFVVSP